MLKFVRFVGSQSHYNQDAGHGGESASGYDVPSKPPRSFSPSSSEASAHSAGQIPGGSNSQQSDRHAEKPNGYNASANESENLNSAGLKSNSEHENTQVMSSAADKQKQVSRKPAIPEVLVSLCTNLN